MLRSCSILIFTNDKHSPPLFRQIDAPGRRREVPKEEKQETDISEHRGWRDLLHQTKRASKQNKGKKKKLGECEQERLIVLTLVLLINSCLFVYVF